MIRTLVPAIPENLDNGRSYSYWLGWLNVQQRAGIPNCWEQLLRANHSRDCHGKGSLLFVLQYPDAVFLFHFTCSHPDGIRLQAEDSFFFCCDSIGQETALIDRLINELKLKENLYLSRILSFSEEELQEEDVLRNELLKLSDELTRLGVTPSKIDVTEF